MESTSNYLIGECHASFDIPVENNRSDVAIGIKGGIKSISISLEAG